MVSLLPDLLMTYYLLGTVLPVLVHFVIKSMKYVLSIYPDNADNVQIGNLKIIKNKINCPRSHY